MASNTENLNLLMKNPSTDGADTFNVQTMLNENWQKIDNNAGTVAQTLANILKPTTPPIIGLPPSTTPDGMFQALGNTGELHVWRKTVVTTEPIPEQPAGYNLDAKTNFLIGTPSRSSREPYINVTYANAVSVSGNGTVNISGDSSSISGWYPSNGDSPNYLQMRGKFIKITQFVYLDAPRTVDMDTVYYIPNDATATLPNYGSASGEFRIEMQKVVGYPYTPAIPTGTTTTYPVSTNPNAYQEGDDAKEAGYVVGEVVTGSFQVKGKVNYPTRWHLSKTINVADDGTITVPGNVSNIGYTASEASFRGMFGMLEDANSNTIPFAPGVVVYFPTDVNITDLNIDRYQPVTGYAAIPASTTIEYLGKLGDKARVQVVSYVGTGTYGKDNPCSITADFKINTILFLSFLGNNGNMLINNYATRAMIGDVLTTEYVASRGFSDQNSSYPTYGKKSADGKTFSWYHEYNSSYQCNNSGFKYYYLVISN